MSDEDDGEPRAATAIEEVEACDGGVDVFGELLRVMHKKGDFPAMAGTVARVSSLSSSLESSASELAAAILQDYSLSNKVLRIVNSAIYRPTVEIGTVSRAIVYLGWDAVRSIVLTLKLFESMPAETKSKAAEATLRQAFCSAMVAKNLTRAMRSKHDEQAYICALFHTFGKTAIAYYLPEKDVEIRRRLAEDSRDPESAERVVLGRTYAELGIAAAAELNFPKTVSDCMQTTAHVRIPGHPSMEESMQGAALVGNRIARAMLDPSEDAPGLEQMKKLMKRFKKQFGGPEIDVKSLIETSMRDISKQAKVMGLAFDMEPGPSRLLADLGLRAAQTDTPAIAPEASETPTVVVPADQAPTVRRPASDAPTMVARSPSRGQTPHALPAVPSEIGRNAVAHEKEMRFDSEAVFTRGIEETIASQDGKHTLNDLLVVVLETIFRGLGEFGVRRVSFLIKDPRNPRLVYRTGFGAMIDAGESGFIVPLGTDGKLLARAITRGEDIYVEGVERAKLEASLPACLNGALAEDPYLLALPILVNRKPIGLFFVDGAGRGLLSKQHFDYIKILRDQVVQSIVKAAV